MNRRCFIGLLTIQMCWSGLLLGQDNAEPRLPTAVDMIPADATAAVVISDFSRFRKSLIVQAKKLNYDGNNLGDNIGFLEFTLKSTIENELGQPAKLLGDTAVAAVFMEDNEYWKACFSIGVKDMAAALKTLDLTEDNFPENTVVNSKSFDDSLADNKFVKELQDKYAFRKGNQILVGKNRPQVIAALKSETLRQNLTDDEIETFEKQDFIVYESQVEIAPDGTKTKRDYGFLKDVMREFSTKTLADHLESGAIGFRFEDGFGFTISATLSDEAKQKYLQKLSKKDANASLNGLPDGKVILATALTGGEQFSKVAEAVREGDEWNWFLGWLSRDEKMSPRLQSNLFHIFQYAWNKIDESRFAAYLNEKPEDDGLAILVTILDTQDADAFLNGFVSMGNFVNASLLPPEEAEEELAIDDQQIASLVQDLGDPSFNVRELATTKLKLLGLRAFPALEDATKSSDIELRLRAKGIIDSYKRTKLAGQRQALKLHPEDISRFKIKFAYLENQEQIQDADVSHIRIHFEDPVRAAKVMVELEQMLGKDWNKVRLVAVGNQVAIAWGSQTDLLARTIANLKNQEPGLASKDRYRSFAGRINMKSTAQVHVSLSQIKHLIFDDVKLKPQKKTNSAISLGLLVEPKRIRVDAHLTIDEIQMLIDESLRRMQR